MNINLTNQNYKVVANSSKYGHFYDILSIDDKILEKDLLSVTKILEIIGWEKAKNLKAWEVRQAVSAVGDELLKKLATSTFITSQDIQDAVEKGKQRPKYILKEAADLGTMVHNLIDDYIISDLRGEKAPEPIITDSRVSYGYRSFLDLVAQHQIKFLMSDTPVASLKFKYGGRLDSLIYFDGCLHIADWKTSSGIRDSYFLQGVAYLVALWEMYGIEPTHVSVFRFDKEKIQFEYKTIPADDLINVWLNCLAFFKDYTSFLSKYFYSR